MIQLRYMTWFNYVDIETGELISKTDFNNNYYEVNRITHAKANKRHTIKHITHTIAARRKPIQGDLFGSNQKRSNRRNTVQHSGKH